MTRVFAGERTFLSPLLQPIEISFIARLASIQSRNQRWTVYAVAMLLFNFAGFLLLYVMGAVPIHFAP